MDLEAMTAENKPWYMRWAAWVKSRWHDGKIWWTLYKWCFLVGCLALAGCSLKIGRHYTDEDYHGKHTLCLPCVTWEK